MQISLNGRFKSLNTFQSESLAPFTVITGKNGCGKSQLIEIISLAYTGSTLPKEVSITLEPNPKRIQVNGLEPQQISSINSASWVSVLKQQHTIYSKFTDRVKSALGAIQDTNLEIDNFSSDTDVRRILEPFSKELLKDVRDLHNIQFKGSDRIAHIEQVFSESKTFRFINRLAHRHKKKILDLDKRDFDFAMVDEELFDTNDLFDAKIESIFYSYALKRDQNAYGNYRNANYNEKRNTIPHKEFEERFKPPWDILNGLLAKHGLNFKFPGIKAKDFEQNAQYNFTIKKRPGNTPIQFGNLSSGEKVIIKLLIMLFVADFYQKDLAYPDLIILDEPDAHLHPEMSKTLVDVLYETFVKELGIKVIMTTHSPSTVALTEEENIFELTNSPQSALRKITKDAALELLTKPLPRLSIDYKNHRQIFVESPTDLDYYQCIFDKLNQKEKPNHRLYFISNGYGKGHKTNVISIVEQLRLSGNQSAFGLVDWDFDKATNNEYIYIHGNQERYSIENFILDPMYFIVLMLEITAENIHSELNIPLTTDPYSVSDWDEGPLQTCVDWFFAKISDAVKNRGNEMVKVHYYSGQSLSLPKWYLQDRGHNHYSLLKENFQFLGGKFPNEIDLLKHVIVLIGRCYPFIPRPTIEILQKLSK